MVNRRVSKTDAKQLRQVRGTIPRLVEPLLLQHGSPEDLYIRYSQNALDTGKEIRALADLVETHQYQEILQRAKDSRTAEPDGITPWMVTEHADWLELRKLDDESDISAHREPQDTVKSADQAGQDASVVLEQFKVDHPRIDVKLQEGNHKIIEVRSHVPLFCAIISNRQRLSLILLGDYSSAGSHTLSNQP